MDNYFKKLNESFDSMLKESGGFGRQPIFEFENGEYFYVEKRGDKLIAGGATNVGIIPEFEIDYDEDDSYDGNLERLYDKILEERPELVSECKESLDEVSESFLTEAPYLEPEYDSRKSFYNKAWVDTDADGNMTLSSYGTPVVKIVDGEVQLLPRWAESATTLRHVKEFLKQQGFEVGSLQQMSRMYGTPIRKWSQAEKDAGYRLDDSLITEGRPKGSKNKPKSPSAPSFEKNVSQDDSEEAMFDNERASKEYGYKATKNKLHPNNRMEEDQRKLISKDYSLYDVLVDTLSEIGGSHEGETSHWFRPITVDPSNIRASRAEDGIDITVTSQEEIDALISIVEFFQEVSDDIDYKYYKDYSQYPNLGDGKRLFTILLYPDAYTFSGNVSKGKKNEAKPSVLYPESNFDNVKVDQREFVGKKYNLSEILYYTLVGWSLQGYKYEDMYHPIKVDTLNIGDTEDGYMVVNAYNDREVEALLDVADYFNIRYEVKKPKGKEYSEVVFKIHKDGSLGESIVSEGDRAQYVNEDESLTRWQKIQLNKDKDNV